MNLAKAAAQLDIVLSPIEVGIDEYVFGLSAGEGVEEGEVIGVRRDSAADRPNKENAYQAVRPLALSAELHQTCDTERPEYGKSRV